MGTDKLFAVLILPAAIVFGFAVADILEVGQAEKSPQKRVGELKEIRVVSGEKTQITLENGMVYLVKGEISQYKPGDEVSVPVENPDKYVCLRTGCMRLF